MPMIQTRPETVPKTNTRPQVLQANWSAPTNIHTLITTNFDGFNLATHVGDNEEHVINNRHKLAGFMPSTPLWLNQIHGTNVIEADKIDLAQITTNSITPDADACISHNSRIVCVVMTADCLPILLTNRQGEFVAAIHAGWRGLNAGIIKNTLSHLAKFDRQEILAFIGPAIGEECFEIGAEVYKSFVDNDSATAKYFKDSLNFGKFMANLRGIAAHQLIGLGLLPNNISNSNICTKCHSDWFYSYRANPQTGRFACLIWKD